MDHSQTYKDKKLKNFPHRLRLNSIISVLDKMNLAGKRYCDVGCSNGFLTNLISEKFKFSDAMGLDHTLSNIALANERYPSIKFRFIDLNKENDIGEKFDFISCFETLEHVGDIQSAINNLVELSNDGSTILISVPIEVGFIGLVKFLLKTVIYRYKLTEINSTEDKKFYFKYLFSLIKNENISKYRAKKTGYGTHFGFDYRVVCSLLDSLGLHYFMQRSGTTMFFIVQCQSGE